MPHYCPIAGDANVRIRRRGRQEGDGERNTARVRLSSGYTSCCLLVHYLSIYGIDRVASCFGNLYRPVIKRLLRLIRQTALRSDGERIVAE